MFLRDHWYVAALSLGAGVTARLATDPGRARRCSTDASRARSWRSPTRVRTAGYPLSLGTVVGEQLVCGYHGFTFDCSGTCVAVPGQDRIPSRANVRTYPVGRAGLVGVDLDGPRRGRLRRSCPRRRGSIDDRATGRRWSASPGSTRPFDLLVDNLLDLSHETYLHNGSIGTPEVATTPIEVEVDEDVARRSRLSPHERRWSARRSTRAPPASTGKIDRWQDIEYFAPGFYLLQRAHRRRSTSRPAPDGSDDHAFHMKILYGLTPSTEGSVYDFWALARDFCVGDAEVDVFLGEDADGRRARGRRRAQRPAGAPRESIPRSPRSASRSIAGASPRGGSLRRWAMRHGSGVA